METIRFLIAAFLTIFIAYPVYPITLEQVNTTSVQTMTNKAMTSVKLNTNLTLNQTTANYTIVWNDPAAGRTLTISDPLGNDTFAFIAATQTFTNKTMTSPVLGGTVTGTYTLAGTPTITSPTITGTVGGGATYSAPVLSGTVTGTYTLGGTPTITSPTINTPKQLHSTIISVDKFSTTDICAATTGAIDQIGATVTTLIIPSSVTCTTNKTIPSTLTLWFVGQGQITVSTGVTLTLNSQPIAGLSQIFVLSGTGVVAFGSGYTAEVYVLWWGGKGDDSTDNSTAFNNTISALPTNGGEIFVGEGQWRLNASAIDPGAKNVKIRGIGWKTLVATSFGDAQWTAANAIKGSVLKVTGTANGITLNNATYRKLILEDIAIVGPGSGTSIGVDAGSGAQNNQLIFRNVGIFNFATGLRLKNSLDGQFHELFISGTTTGINFTTSTTNHKFYGLTLQSNTTGMTVGSASLIKIYGGLVQSNTTGINLTPEASGVIAGFYADGIWFESNTSSWKLDSTNGTITDIGFSNCREATAFTMTPTVVSAISRIFIENCQASGWNLDFSNAGITQINLIGGFLGTITPSNDAIQRLVRLNSSGISSFTSAGKTITYAATVTPVYMDGEVQEITLTGNVTINVPTDMPRFGLITFIIRQDGTGARTVTWGAGYHTAWSDTGNTANKYSTITFYHINGQFIQVGAQSPYFS